MFRMLRDIIDDISSDGALLACAGFEPRVLQSTNLLIQRSAQFRKTLLATYPDPENKENEATLGKLLPDLHYAGEAPKIAPLDDDLKYTQRVTSFLEGVSHVYCDISGFSTLSLFKTLELLIESGVEFSVLYTEAEEYHPTRQEFDSFVSMEDPESNIENLRNYEQSSIVHSDECTLSIVDGFEGNFSPGYPYFLIAFLPFKRSRLGLLLEEISASERLLIVGEPDREDLKWRAEMLRRINFDLINDGSSQIQSLSTLDSKSCLEFLESMYRDPIEQICYRYNVVLAPLGSKMQKVACWAFARRNPNVGVVVTSPTDVYSDNYSTGSGETFVLPNVHEWVGLRNVG